jgi:hypothetical protein
MGTGGMIPEGESGSIRRKPRPSVTGSGIEPGPPRGDTATGRLSQGTLTEQPGMHDASAPEQLSSHLTEIPSVPTVTTSATCQSVSLTVLTNFTANFLLFIFMLSSFSTDVLKKPGNAFVSQSTFHLH